MPTDASILEQLRQMPASHIESAIGLLGARPRNMGVLAPGFTQLSRSAQGPTAVGYALTVRMGVSGAIQPVNGFDWYTFASHVAGPKVLCVAPAESLADTGVLFGQMSARVLGRLGVVGALVDGFVRDTAALNQMGFALMARGAMLRHGVPGVADYGKPVEIGQVRIETGYIVAFDSDGAISFPVELLRRIPEGLARMKARTQPVLDYLSQASPVSPAGIVAAQKEGNQH